MTSPTRRELHPGHAECHWWGERLTTELPGIPLVYVSLTGVTVVNVVTVVTDVTVVNVVTAVTVVTAVNVVNVVTAVTAVSDCSECCDCCDCDHKPTGVPRFCRPGNQEQATERLPCIYIADLNPGPSTLQSSL